MAELKFEGEVQSLSEKQISLIKDVIVERGYNNNKVLIEPVGEKGDNYVATVLRIIVDNDKGKPFKMVAKVASSVELVRQTMNQAMMFLNEILIYNEVLPKMDKLQEDADIPESERFRHPICYGYVSEELHEIILLEDMNEDGYIIFDRMQPLSENSIKLALKDLAKFHSLSYALKQKEPDTYESFRTRLLNLFLIMSQSPETRIYFEMMETDVVALLEGEKYKNAVKNTMSKIFEIASKLNKFDRASKFSVIQQGDCWSNNILFKVEEGESVSSVLIDYQIAREGNPVGDLFYFIFNCSSYETRSKFINEWFDLYHSELDKFLSNFGLKTTLIYPRDQFDADMRIHAKYAIAMKCLIATTVQREGKDILNVEEAVVNHGDNAKENLRVLHINDQTKEKLKSTISGAIDSLLELGFL